MRDVGERWRKRSGGDEADGGWCGWFEVCCQVLLILSSSSLIELKLYENSEGLKEKELRVRTRRFGVVLLQVFVLECCCACCFSLCPA